MAQNITTILTWEGADFTWSQAPLNTSYPPYTWDEVQLLIRAAGDDYSQWVDFEKKKLVKIILKVHGSTITEQKQKEIKEYKIKVNDIKLAIKKIKNIGIITENIKL